MRKTSDTIEFRRNVPHLILCEGADACHFLIRLLAVFGENDPCFGQFCVYDFGGIKELRRYLRTMVGMDEFRNSVSSLSVIRDAETDAAGACQSIRDALRTNELAVPEAPRSWTNTGSSKYPGIRTGFLLFPTCDANPQNGTLEDLCLRILPAPEAKNILSAADAALEQYRPQLRRLHKNRLHTYFSLTDKFVSLKVGEAASAGAFDWDAPEIESLKTFFAAAAGD